MKKTVLPGVLALGLILLIASCGGSSAAAGNEGVMVWRGTVGGGRLVNNLNPHTISVAGDSDIASFLFATLLVRNPRSTEWEFIPAMASALPTISEDGLVWTFPIRRGLTWSTGTPINAHTYEYSLRMLLDPKLVNRNATTYWTNVDVVNARAYFLGENAPDYGLPIVTWDDVGIKAIDDYTLQFTLSTRTLPLIGIQTLGTSSSAWLVYESLYEAGMNADRTETTYGTGDLMEVPYYGAYRLTDFVLDQYLELQKNPNFILADYYTRETFSFRLVDIDSVRDQLFTAGETDTLSIPAASYDTWMEDPRTRQGRGGQPWHIYLNTQSTEVAALRDVNFRQALYYSVDRDTLAFAAFRTFIGAAGYIGTQAVVGDVFAGTIEAYRDSQYGRTALPANLGYDLTIANRYFDVAFANNGNQRIQFNLGYFEGQDSMRRMAEVLQEMWMNAFGADRLNVVIVAVPPSALYDSYADRTHQAGIGSMTQNSLNIWASMQVWTSTFTDKIDTFFNAEFDDLFTRTTTGDLLFASADERARALMRMEQLLLEYAPVIPLFQNTNWVAYSERTHLLSEDFLAAGLGFLIDRVDPMAWTSTAP